MQEFLSPLINKEEFFCCRKAVHGGKLIERGFVASGCYRNFFSKSSTQPSPSKVKCLPRSFLNGLLRGSPKICVLVCLFVCLFVYECMFVCI